MENRILTLQEVSEYLKIDEGTVLKLAESGNIPAVKLGDTWRFRADFIESWMETEMIRGFSGYLDVAEAEREIYPQSIHSLVSKSCMELSLKGHTKYDVLVEMVNLAECSGLVNNRRKLVFSLLEREYLCSTGMANGIAIPHPRFRLQDIVKRPFIVIGRSQDGVDFEALDGQLSYLFFLICLKFDELHVQVMARLSRLLRNQDFVENIRNAKTPHEVMSIIEDGEKQLLLAG